MSETQHGQMALLSDYLATRRDAILQASRAAEDRDPEQTTVRSLTRTQFADHIPQVLESFAQRLRLQLRATETLTATAQRQSQETKHGLHRWQQGYRLRELMREWGHFHRCLFDEIEGFAQAHPEIARGTIVEAQRVLLELVSEAIGESAGEYARLQQDEAAGVLADLQRTLGKLQEIDRRRTGLIHEAVHDLRGNVQSVSSAAQVLGDPSIPEQERAQFVNSLQHGTEAVGAMLGQLMDLVRLEAGQEVREISSFDAAEMLQEFCRVSQSLARDQQLFLRGDGPTSLHVHGDFRKVRRIVQNLVLNSLEYTERGGVTLSWGETGAANWWVKIEDTGPGLMRGPGAPIIEDMVDATDSARESDRGLRAGDPSRSDVLPEAEGQTHSLPPRQSSGEGIGLSIVKRLCELLDASIELASSKESGTTFRVLLPRTYPESAGK